MSTTTQSRENSRTNFDAIEQAFHSVWKTLYAHVSSDNRQAEELKVQLSQTLVSLVSDGITDPKELRRKALENMALSLG
jgi:hypothetical protein